MTRMSCFALIVVSAVVSMASPTLAKPLNFQGDVTHLTPRRAVGPRHHYISVRNSGIKAFALESRNFFNPSLAGGGSIGYNESLIKDQ
jgi:hypothetical protein